MELQLTKRWIEYRSNQESKELKEGLQVEYYAVDYKWKEKPSVGAVKKDDKGFFIEWEDTYSDTRIDDSEKSNEILKYCGWV